MLTISVKVGEYKIEEIVLYFISLVTCFYICYFS